jgi:pyridoxine 5-phosphate synthase
MTSLSVNLNKIALLRNSRGRDYPNIVEYAKKFVDLGVQGITIHPRQDERHAKRTDAIELGRLLADYEDVEFNIEGYPSADFLELIVQVVPDQCTLVPDDVNQLTSDHGWQVERCRDILVSSLDRLNGAGVRSSLFLDPDLVQIEAAANIGCDRIELYTEEFAETFYGDTALAVFEKYENSAKHAQSLGLGVNAGHDLDLTNLGRFLEIENILEVSIGHALTIECIDQGIENVVGRYLEICCE